VPSRRPLPWRHAQTKLSGTAQCPATPSESHATEVGDHPGHAYTIVKGGCTWTKPFEIAGLKSKDDAAAEFSEIDANRARDHSSRVEGMDNGDECYLRTQGTHTMKDQNTRAAMAPGALPEAPAS
jgi:hypothetical protein